MALAVLVEATDFDRLNQFAVDHLQPVAAGKGHPRLNNLAELVVSPASPTFAAVLIGAAAAVLLARRRPRAAFAWPAALAAAFVIEVVCKLVVDQHRSGIWHGFGLTFDSSFPSGHMLRAILLAGAAAAVWPRLRTPLAWWCVAVAGCAAGQRLAPAHRHRRRRPGRPGAGELGGRLRGRSRWTPTWASSAAASGSGSR